MDNINLLLLVEDDENDILLTERKIQRSNLPVVEIMVARSLEDAKQFIQAGKTIDLILLDLNLGDSRGLDTLVALRPIYDGVIIVLTSLEDEKTGIAAIRAGAEDYLVKNRVTEERLRSSVAFSMQRHKIKKTVQRVQDNLDLLTQMTDGGK